MNKRPECKPKKAKLLPAEVKREKLLDPWWGVSQKHSKPRAAAGTWGEPEERLRGWQPSAIGLCPEGQVHRRLLRTCFPDMAAPARGSSENFRLARENFRLAPPWRKCLRSRVISLKLVGDHSSRPGLDQMLPFGVISGGSEL